MTVMLDTASSMRTTASCEFHQGLEPPAPVTEFMHREACPHRR
jgi:hypothetical protein